METKDDPKFNRKDSKRPDNNRKDNNNNNNLSLKTGVKKSEAEVAESYGYKQEKDVQIVIGAKETLGTREMRE